jgi:hypothetical protein
MRTRRLTRQREQALPAVPNTHAHLGPFAGRPNVQGSSDIIAPFLVTGGWASFQSETFPNGTIYNPAPHGVQLVTSVYIPPGRVGFLKEVRIGPREPAVITDVWKAGGIRGPYASTPIADTPFSDVAWRFDTGAQGNRTSQTLWGGIWEEPFGWEAFRDPDSEFSFYPAATWHWQMTLVRGSLDALRRSNNIPPFTLDNPASWFLVDNIPVPFGSDGFNAYPAGLPGSPVGVQFQPQRMQSNPSDPLAMNLFVGEDTTLCLFATWEQKPVDLGITGITTNSVDPAPTQFFGIEDRGDYLVGPSFGSLLGYTQPSTSVPAVVNATQGWGG